MSALLSRVVRYTGLYESAEIGQSHDEPEKAADLSKLPLGIQFLQKCFKTRISCTTHKFLALFLTFLTYASYHASRRPLNVVKPILSPYDELSESETECANEETSHVASSTSEGWDPFIGKSGESLLVGLDFSFLLSYAIGVVLAGRIADRSNLRNFLLWGMLGSGCATAIFGLGYFLNIHQYAFYLILQIVIGFLQATGWPAVVAIVAQWFGKDNLGFIMGVWDSHTSVGNSVGSALSASVVHYGWGTAFFLLGSFIGVIGILVWFFLVPQPTDAGYPSVCQSRTDMDAADDNLTNGASEEKKGISWTAAVSIPGVIPFSIALFFSKFVAYTFLFWLPYYIASTCIGGRQRSAEEAGDFSILFDIGGIAGGICAGILYDMTRSGATISVLYGLCSIPLLLIYNAVGRHSVVLNMVLLVFCGFCVNGPYALITTAVSATLGTHESIAGNERALSTVAAIIDGMGSLGAALGPTITGRILSGSRTSFNYVFLMLSAASLMGVLTLSRVAWMETKIRRRVVADGIEMERLVRKSSV